MVKPEIGERNVSKCACGKSTSSFCYQLWSPNSLTPCYEPLCSATPACTSHRHAPGTMGYPSWSSATQYKGDEPDGEGFWEWLKSRCREWFWSDLKKAQSTYEEVCANFPPPAPWPWIQLQIKWRTFECRGGEVRLMGRDELKMPQRRLLT